jgi:hypothetical protein
MKLTGSLISIILFTFFVAGSLTSANGQSVADRYLISARAGGINYVQGTVTSVSEGDVASAVFKGDRISSGDLLRTGADSRAEVLLNPGSYVRLGSNTEIKLIDDSFDDLRLSVDRGSAIFEIYATKDFIVTVVTKGGDVVFSRSGIYRVDAGNAGQVKVDVFEGRASLASDARLSAGSGKSLTIANGNAVVAGFDRKKTDDLASWSKSRSKTLAEATASLRNGDLRHSLISSFNLGEWNMYNTFGVWVYDWRFRRFLFMPFGFGWYTPYGFYYGPGIHWFNLPPIIVNSPPPTGTPTGNNTPNPSPSGGNDGVKTRARAATPAYTKIETDRTNTPVRHMPLPTVFDDTGARVRASAPIISAPAAESVVASPTGSKPTRP